MRTALKFATFILILFFLLSPTIIFAQSSLVPCGLKADLSDQCQFCNLIELIQRVINFIVLQLAAPVATLLIAWAGIRLVVQAGNEEARKQAKTLLKDILIGFLWILLAWTAVITVLNMLVKDVPKGSGSQWFKIQCFANYSPGTIDFTIFQAGSLSNVSVREQDCPNCIELSKSEFNFKNNNKVNPDILLNMNALKTELEIRGIKKIDWQITEAWPPTVSHQNQCHRNGTCIDANVTNPTPANLAKFSQAASEAKMKAVYEVKTQSEADALLKGINASGGKAQIITTSSQAPSTGVSIQVVPQITGSHFSVYKI